MSGVSGVVVSFGRKIAGAILDGAIDIFHWLNPSGRITAPTSTKLETKGSTGVFPENKGGQFLGLTTLPPS